MDSTDRRPRTAAVLIIGNEVLSGRVRDANLQFLGARLRTIGIRVADCRVIPDDEAVIVSSVNEMRASHDYVFTTGGIGPTHDDITASSIARAFEVPIEQNAEATRRLESYYRDAISAARLRMAQIPVGGELLENPVSFAPGFRMENVYVLPGVPRIMQEMFDAFAGELQGGAPLLARTVTAFVSESEVADPLRALQDEHEDVEIGSYPFLRGGRLGTALVARGTDPAAIAAVASRLVEIVESCGVTPDVADGEVPMEFED